jgi:hypothetical protein
MAEQTRPATTAAPAATAAPATTAARPSLLSRLGQRLSATSSRRVGVEPDEDEAAEMEHLRRPAYAPLGGLFGRRQPSAAALMAAAPAAAAAPAPTPAAAAAPMPAAAAAAPLPAPAAAPLPAPAAEAAPLPEPSEEQRQVLRERLGWRAAYLDAAVERKAAAMADAAAGRMTPEGERYLGVVAGLWLPEEQARYFAASVGRPWEALPEAARRELRDTFDMLHPIQRLGRGALEARRAELAGMPTAPQMPRSEPAAVAQAAAFAFGSAANPFEALPPTPQLRAESLRWFSMLSPGYARATLGDGVYMGMRRSPPAPEAVAAVDRAYERTLAKLREWWASLPAATRLDYRKIFGASVASEMDLIKLAYKDLGRRRG